MKHEQILVDDDALHRRGIFDTATGMAIAAARYEEFQQIVNNNVRLSPEITPTRMGLLSIVSRASGYHAGTLHGIEANNPYATFALLRCYAENAAALLWILDRPADLGRISFLAEESEQFAIGRLVAHANKRARGFSAIYEQLSRFAHPVPSTFTHGWEAAGEGSSTATWQSTPRFKMEADRVVACFWLVELTEIHQSVWPRLYAAGKPRGRDTSET